MYWHTKLRLLLMVYVDDFKMAGPSGHLEACWESITEGIKLVGTGLVPTYLGCDHVTFEGQSHHTRQGHTVHNAAMYGVLR